jgi:hypothetical protein
MSHGLTLLVFALTAGGPQGPGKATPLVCGVGVTAPSGKVLYLPSAAGGVEAVALFNGKQLWEAKAAQTPLLATADRVFALARLKGQRNQVRVVALDAATGEPLLRSEAITFPAWVSVQRDFGLRFTPAARLESGALLLLWKAWRFRDGGPPPPQFGPDGKPYVDPNARKAAGAVRVDLASGKAAAVAGYQPRDAEFPETEPSWVGPTKLHGWVLRLEEQAPEPGFPHSLTRRTLRAATADGARSWQRRLAGEPYLPPRP